MAEAPGCLPCPEGWHVARDKCSFISTRLQKVPGLLSLQEVANASTMEQSGVM